MAKFVEQYGNLWDRIKGDKKSHEIAVGGDFDVAGILELNVLKEAGLKPNHSLIDIGCGSGRLAYKLAGYSKARYLGTDILPDLLEHARQR
jgi:SAM-dependent methyltransferase